MYVCKFFFKVTSFKPMLGPWEGGTNITIRGINLGKEFRDIYGGITVAGESLLLVNRLVD